MAWEIGDLTGSSTHLQFISTVKNLAVSAGWTSLRNESDEWIGFSEGFSETEEIYLGVKAHWDATNDYYNIVTGVFSGYASTNSFLSQPDARLKTTQAHNSALRYYLSINEQRIAFCLKVASYFLHGYAGKFFPYSKPSQYPYPVVSGGMSNGQSNVRYNSTALSMPYRGIGGGASDANTHIEVRTPGGLWFKPWCLPWSVGGTKAYSLLGAQGNYCLIPAGDMYQIEPVILQQTDPPYSVWGELDGIYGVSGFNATTENVMQIGGTTVNQSGKSTTQIIQDIHTAGGRAFVMLQNASSGSWADFIAMEMIQ